MGTTARYKEIVSSQVGRFGNYDSLIGLQLHSFANDMENEGATIRNVRFSGFKDTLSSRTALIDIDEKKPPATLTIGPQLKVYVLMKV